MFPPGTRLPSPPMPVDRSRDGIVRLKNNFQGEVDGAVLYDALADAETHERTAGVLRRLAALERSHGRVAVGQQCTGDIAEAD
jgi:hypothetical protein